MKARRAAASSAVMRSSASRYRIQRGWRVAAASSSIDRLAASSQPAWSGRAGRRRRRWTRGSASRSARVPSVEPSSRATTASAKWFTEANHPGRSASPLRTGSRTTRVGRSVSSVVTDRPASSTRGPIPKGPSGSRRTGWPGSRGVQGTVRAGAASKPPKSVGHWPSGSAWRYFVSRASTWPGSTPPRCWRRMVVRTHAGRGISTGTGGSWSRPSGRCRSGRHAWTR